MPEVRPLVIGIPKEARPAVLSGGLSGDLSSELSKASATTRAGQNDNGPRGSLVALVPSQVPLLTTCGLRVLVEAGAGEGAGFDDDAYRHRGADLAPDRSALFETSDILLHAGSLSAAAIYRAQQQAFRGQDELARLGPQHCLIGLNDPLAQPDAVRAFAERGVTLFSMELIPRIARAQSMDVLSSLATIVGYKAVLLAAARLPKLFPMLTTAAGTIPPARVLIIGAGVAGLQAIATARRLGAAVSAYDVRPAAKEQIESLGARAVSESAADRSTETTGGYAIALSQEQTHRQQALLAPVVASSDVVITTAAVPGRSAPLLLTAEMVASMMPGSIVVDLAADRGGNCAVTQTDQEISYQGVTVMGPTQLPSTVPTHASQMYGRNLANFVRHLCKDGTLHINLDDEIIRDTLIARDGTVVHPRVLDQLHVGSDPSQAGRPH